MPRPPGRGFLCSAFVALLNDYTCLLLVRAVSRLPSTAQKDASAEPEPSLLPRPQLPAAARGCVRRRRVALDEARSAQDFEELAYAAGGPALKLGAQLALCILLLGSMCSNLAVIAEASSRALRPLRAQTTLARPYVPPGLAGDAVMLILLLAVITPLTATKNMSSLQHVAGAGASLLALLLVAVVIASTSPQAAGLASARAANSRVGGASSSQAFVVLSFAFYVQPMLLPLLRELSEGSFAERSLGQERVTFAACGSERSPGADAELGAGVDSTPGSRARAAAALEISVHATMLLALAVYTLLGVCGVVAFGPATSEDVLLNFTGPTGFVLDSAMVLYLAVCFAPTCHAMRRVVYALLDGPSAPLPPRSKHLWRVIGLNASAACVALFVPRSETLFAVTGALGVSVVCYLFPVLLHMRLVRYSGLDSGSLPVHSQLLNWVNAWGIPIAAVALCTYYSAAGLVNTMGTTGRGSSARDPAG